MRYWNVWFALVVTFMCIGADADIGGGIFFGLIVYGIGAVINKICYYIFNPEA